MIDWKGDQVNEPQPTDIIQVWEIEPHSKSGYSHCVVHNWQGVLDEIKIIAEAHLEAMEPEALLEGLNIKVRLRPMFYSDYLDAQED